MVLVPLHKKKRADLCSNTKSTLNRQPSKERLKIMTMHGSATAREQSPHANEHVTEHLNQTTKPATLDPAVKRRAQAIVNDKSIDSESRAIIRFGLEINDPWLPELVQR